MEETQPQPQPQATSSYGKRPLWQWIILYVIIGLLVYGVVYYFFFAKKGGYNSSQTGNQYQYPTQTQQVTAVPTMTTAPSQAATPSSTPTATTQTVTLSATGFTPATITIKAGTTVTWVNNSGEEATVNSDPHPTHTDYPPLNLGQFANGAKLSLQFSKPGTYGYHNHLNPSEHGTIIVE